MNRVSIVIEPAAKLDIRSARDFYSDKGENTSERFRDELTQVFDLLSRHPEGVVHVTGVQYGGLGWDEFERRQF
ncbi:MAG: type II toxin-antitoxin system RelE/ParE family toxin [Planctomycetaceae bacterium]|nr:type II toxin-antitoxin system RelE/ParE family toxin [Planctomycetaceae bacterium]